MKRFILTICVIVITYCLNAQSADLKVQTFVLHNGMKVLLCEDHSKPEIYGGVCVQVGSKNDPADATGMAHYFEHIMFKGTDKIGTLNWEAEKPYLDKISALYDEIQKTTEIARRKELQKEINEVSLEAVQFAIPNEVDVILGKMGGKGINASTSNDHTVYHNMFPSNQLEKWLMVYAERLRNPVFRLFQSELETVYEEYNMYADDPFSVLMEDVTKEVFSGHPYAIPIIGFPEHLKNPQMSKMQTFYKTFYVPRNMTLILVGDFEVDSLKPLLEQTMGKLENGDSKKETVPFPSVSNIKGQKMITTRQTPVKVGAIVYNSVPASDSQAFYLDICSQLFSNNASTGLLDKLMNDNQLYMTGCFNFSLVEAGAFSFIYVPKIIGQSHEKAEKLIFNAIQDLKTGSFSDDLFEAVRTDYLKNAIEELENIPGKFMTILILEMSGKTADDYLKEIELVKNMSKEDMVKIANHFFQHDYLIYRSNMGSKKKNKIEKPEWKPIIAQNTEAKSEFAQMIEEIKLPPTKPQVIDFNKDVTTLPLTSSFNLYASPNPYNDIFSLKITYQYGSICDIDLEYAIQYFNLQGTENKNFEQFQLELQRMGASFDVEVKNNSTIVRITGFEKDLLQILKLCREKLDHPGNDESKLKILIENHQNDLKMMKENSDSWAYALRNYALFGEKSDLINTPALKDIKSYTGRFLLDKFTKALQYEGYVTYVGNVPAQQLQNIFLQNMTFPEKATQGNEELIPLRQYETPVVYVIHNDKFLQNNLYYYSLGNKLDESEKPVCALFNEYFDGGMNGIIFQEIRELRSLGYSASAYYTYDERNRRPGYLIGFLGTQSDKTIDGISAMRELIVKIPRKTEKFKVAQESLLHKNASEYIDFRNIPESVVAWQKIGYTADPRPLFNQRIAAMNFADIMTFYEKNIANHPLIVTVSGDLKRINKKKLQPFGKVIEVKWKQIVNE